MRNEDCPRFEVGLSYIVSLKPLKQAAGDPVSKTNAGEIAQRLQALAALPEGPGGLSP